MLCLKYGGFVAVLGRTDGAGCPSHAIRESMLTTQEAFGLVYTELPAQLAVSEHREPRSLPGR